MSDDSLRILLADPALVSPLAARLRERGSKVEEATSALDALLCARRQRFAAAVVPARLALPGGHSLPEELARESPGLPIVAVGPREAELVLGALRTGACDYLVHGEEGEPDAVSRVLRAATRGPESTEGAELRLSLAEARREVEEKAEAFRELQEIFRHDLERMLLVFEHVGEGILFVDRAGEVVLSNPPANAWLGGAPHGAVGARLDQAVGDPRLREALLEDRSRALAGAGLARVIALEDGRRVRLRTLATERSRGEVDGTVTLLRDLTEEARAKEGFGLSLTRLARRLRSAADALRAAGDERATAIARELEDAARGLRETVRARSEPPGANREGSRAVESPGSLP